MQSDRARRFMGNMQTLVPSTEPNKKKSIRPGCLKQKSDVFVRLQTELLYVRGSLKKAFSF